MKSWARAKGLRHSWEGFWHVIAQERIVMRSAATKRECAPGWLNTAVQIQRLTGGWWRTGDWTTAMKSGPLLAGFLVGIGYYLGAKLGFALTLRPQPVSVLWPPNAILLAALLLTPVRTWWFMLLAVFPAH